MKRIYKIGTVILVVVCLLTFLTVPVSAESYSFNISISRPDFLGKDVSFLEVLLEDEDGRQYVEVYIFVLNIVPGNQINEEQYFRYSILLSLNNDHIGYLLSQSGDTTDMSRYEVFKIDSVNSVLSYFDGRQVIESTGGDSWHSITFDSNILCVNFYNFDIQGSVPNYTDNLTVNYSTDGKILDSLEFLKFLSQDVSNYLPGMAEDTSEILDYLTSIFYSNEDFYQRLDDYFQDNDWSVLSNIDSQLYDIFHFLKGSSTSFGLFDYLSRIGQDIQDSRYYLESLQDLEQNTHVQAPDSESYNPNFDSTAPPRDDSTIQDIADSEEEALGGMTQEEVKEQVDDAFDTESKIEEVGGEEINVENITIVNNLFGDMFSVFGGAWSTFFILNLTIAFAAFLIGRKY